MDSTLWEPDNTAQLLESRKGRGRMGPTESSFRKGDWAKSSDAFGNSDPEAALNNSVSDFDMEKPLSSIGWKTPSPSRSKRTVGSLSTPTTTGTTATPASGRSLTSITPDGFPALPQTPTSSSGDPSTDSKTTPSGGQSRRRRSKKTTQNSSAASKEAPSTPAGRTSISADGFPQTPDTSQSPTSESKTAPSSSQRRKNKLMTRRQMLETRRRGSSLSKSPSRRSNSGEEDAIDTTVSPKSSSERRLLELQKLVDQLEGDTTTQEEKERRSRSTSRSRRRHRTGDPKASSRSRERSDRRNRSRSNEERKGLKTKSNQSPSRSRRPSSSRSRERSVRRSRSNEERYTTKSKASRDQSPTRGMRRSKSSKAKIGSKSTRKDRKSVQLDQFLAEEPQALVNRKSEQFNKSPQSKFDDAKEARRRERRHKEQRQAVEGVLGKFLSDDPEMIANRDNDVPDIRGLAKSLMSTDQPSAAPTQSEAGTRTSHRGLLLDVGFPENYGPGSVDNETEEASASVQPSKDATAAAIRTFNESFTSLASFEEQLRGSPRSSKTSDDINSEEQPSSSRSSRSRSRSRRNFNESSTSFNDVEDRPRSRRSSRSKDDINSEEQPASSRSTRSTSRSTSRSRSFNNSISSMISVEERPRSRRRSSRNRSDIDSEEQPSSSRSTRSTSRSKSFNNSMTSMISVEERPRSRRRSSRDRGDFDSADKPSGSRSAKSPSARQSFNDSTTSFLSVEERPRSRRRSARKVEDNDDQKPTSSRSAMSTPVGRTFNDSIDSLLSIEERPRSARSARRASKSPSARKKLASFQSLLKDPSLVSPAPRKEVMVMTVKDLAKKKVETTLDGDDKVVSVPDTVKPSTFTTEAISTEPTGSSLSTTWDTLPGNPQNLGQNSIENTALGVTPSKDWTSNEKESETTSTRKGSMSIPQNTSQPTTDKRSELALGTTLGPIKPIVPEKSMVPVGAFMDDMSVSSRANSFDVEEDERSVESAPQVKAKRRKSKDAVESKEVGRPPRLTQNKKDKENKSKKPKSALLKPRTNTNPPPRAEPARPASTSSLFEYSVPNAAKNPGWNGSYKSRRSSEAPKRRLSKQRKGSVKESLSNFLADDGEDGFP